MPTKPETGTNGVIMAVREHCQAAETSRRMGALNTGPSHTGISGKGRQELLAFLVISTAREHDKRNTETASETHSTVK